MGPKRGGFNNFIDKHNFFFLHFGVDQNKCAHPLHPTKHLCKANLPTIYTIFQIPYILKRKSHHQSKADMWKIYFLKTKIKNTEK